MSVIEDWTRTLSELFPSTDIEEPFDIGEAVFGAYERAEIGPLTINLRGTDEQPRGYLGASAIGGECMRKTWAQWRNLGDGFPGRIKRLFKSGDIYEERMRHELRAIGFDMYGDQSRFESFGGRVKGHTDGFMTIADLPPALWEAKSANHSRTLKLDKLRRELRDDSEALKQWDRKYWAQCHVYMAAFELDVCLFTVSDKDNDRMVCLLFARDDEAVKDTGVRAAAILGADGPPERAWERAQWSCNNMCDHCDWCWNGKPLPKQCGTCKMWKDGICTKFDLPAHEPCGHYEAVPHGAEDMFSEWEML